ncbi:MAG: transcriptional regulator NrdR [Candidatus Micrarchaeota archaeon]|nr:transcriptional regulator NrdR [Candidatus Micrarchaeota archaeon]
MLCPFCRHRESNVIDTRDTDDYRIRRRRECVKCKRRFTTYEEVEQEDLYVIKKDGRREKFDRHKLMTGVEKACEKRPISREQIEALAGWVESQLRKEGKQEVKSSQIGELVMKRLRKIDEVAYIRFASVYRSFTDIDSFEEALKLLKKKR